MIAAFTIASDRKTPASPKTSWGWESSQEELQSHVESIGGLGFGFFITTPAAAPLSPRAA